MPLVDIKSVVSVFQVRDLDSSLAWYGKWLGEPTILPMEGVAEYELSPGTWLQLSSEETSDLGKSGLILGVEDVQKCQQDLERAGLETGPIADYGIVLVLDIYDPDGNRISFVQELGEG